MDVVFVLDCSSSIWPPDFARQLRFVNDITDRLNVGPSKSQTRIGAISFSDYAKIEFTLGDNLRKVDAVDAVRNIYHRSGGTNTAAALTTLAHSMFLHENGGRLNASRVAIVITDGRSHNRKATAAAARRAQDKGIRILTIGVGPRVDDNELSLIASEPKNLNVFKVTSYRRLQQIQDSMVEKTCRGTKIYNTIKIISLCFMELVQFLFKSRH